VSEFFVTVLRCVWCYSFIGVAYILLNFLRNHSSLTATATISPADTGSISSAKPNQTAAAVDRAYRKKPSNILTGDSDSDSESEDDKLLGSSLICISDSASGTTDGSSSSSSSGTGRSESKAQESSSSSSLALRTEDGDGDDGMKKKKSKPSARKAANLSGITRLPFICQSIRPPHFLLFEKTFRVE
jgi:hypothetical protein